MTVKELIERLKDFDEDLQVWYKNGPDRDEDWTVEGAYLEAGFLRHHQGKEIGVRIS